MSSVRLFIIGIWIIGASVLAQNVFNENCGTILNTGTIRLRTPNAEFRNDAPIAQVVNNGIIEMAAIGNLFTGTVPLGATPTNRIGGAVLWSALQDSQRVQARWYTNLSLSGGIKLISDSIFVADQYLIASSTGVRYYEGTFFYDGTQQQVIVPEHGVNSYTNLVLLNGAVGRGKQLTGDTATVRGIFINHASNRGGMDIASGGVLDLRGESRSESPLTVRGNRSAVLIDVSTAWLRITNASTMLLDGGGLLRVTSVHQPAAVIIDSAATLTLQSTVSNGQLMLLGTAAMNIAGTYRNTAPLLTNATYECGTTVRYIGTTPNQSVQSTSALPNHRYGILETSGADKVATGDIHVGCGLILNTGAVPHRLLMGNSVLVVHHQDSVLTPVRFDTLLSECQSSSEVIGSMRHEGLKGRLVANQVLTFNNRQTRWIFIDTTGVPSSITLTVLPQTAPNSYNPSTDVNRKITVDYGTGSSAPNWRARVRSAYRLDETRSLRGLATFARLRTYNAPSSALPNRIGTRYNRLLDTSCRFLWVEADTIAPAGIHGLTDGSDLLLRAAPSTIASVRDGRWSNPQTWSDQSEPLPYDTVLVRHNVWAGFTRPMSNGWDGYSIPEAYPLAMAARVVIDHTTHDAALIFGADTTAPPTNGLFVIGSVSDYLSAPGRNGMLEIVGCDLLRSPREQLAIDDFVRFAQQTTSAEPKERGLVIFSSLPVPIVRMNMLRNTGWVQNAGRLQIGDE